MNVEGKDPSAYFLGLHQLIQSEISNQEKINSLLALIETVAIDRLQDTGIHFHTLFSLIAYCGYRYRLSSQLLFQIHKFRQEVRLFITEQSSKEPEEIYSIGANTCARFIGQVFQENIPNKLLESLPERSEWTRDRTEFVDFHRNVKALVTEIDTNKDVLYCYSATMPEKEAVVFASTTHIIESFRNQIAHLKENYQPPFEILLLDVQVDREGHLHPRAWVIEPDLLIDITAVASCFQPSGVDYSGMWLKRFMPFAKSVPILLGNLSNYFLDELIAKSGLSWREMMKTMFQKSPLSYMNLTDEDVKKLMTEAQNQFKNLELTIADLFPKARIQPEHCFLEPTFYSNQYGLQGRLDIYHTPPQGDIADIVELKSGKVFRPNAYGLSQSHYIQTLLYDLLIQSTSRKRIKTTNYILYSKKTTEQLCFAPVIKSLQYEALAARNELIFIEKQLLKLDQLEPNKFANTLKEKLDNAIGFNKRDGQILLDTYHSVREIEQLYFLHIVAFIAREHWLAKVGIEGRQNSHGQAGLWLSSRREKEEQFMTFSFLRIAQNLSGQEEPILVLEKTERTNLLANFRQGDLVVLYPSQSNQSHVLDHQLFKATIVQIDDQFIQIRLRARQLNTSMFENFQYWQLEHDMLDSSFSSLYQSSFRLLRLEQRKRDLFLGLIPPAQGELIDVPITYPLSEEQRTVFHKIISSEDYFLLWGPPGTGKTSIMLRYLTQYLLEHTNERILLLAYTNRAVDEICHAIQQIHQNVSSLYVRIGSRYSTAAEFRGQLLHEKAGVVQNREEMRAFLLQQRIVVGTVAAMLGKPELFGLLSFDRVMVDEATQLLEPMVAGLFSFINKGLFIGDHKQLSAVVTQPSRESKVETSALKQIGFVNLNNSWFERIFKRCKDQNWNWSYDILTFQGRMHRDIMHFVNEEFYGKQVEDFTTGFSGYP